MGICSSFVWKKDYTVFGAEGHLQTRSLNFFQRILRYIGFYAETRLATVSALAQAACFKPNPDFSTLEKERIIKIIHKAKELNKHTSTYLGKEPLATGESVRYDAAILRCDPLREYILFNVMLIDPKDKKIREATIKLYAEKNSEEDVNYDKLKLDSLYERDFPARSEFIEDENDLLARVSYLFLTKIVNGSQGVQQMEMTSSGVNGGALLAQKYGWTGPVTEYYPSGIGKPDQLILDRDHAADLAPECQLASSVSLDFFFSPGKE